MKDKKMKILKMIEQGKLTSEQGKELINNFSDKVKKDKIPKLSFKSDRNKALSVISNVVKNIFSNIGNNEREKGEIIKRKVQISDFTDVSLSGAYKIKIEQGEPELIIKGDENVVHEIKVEVENQKLILKNPKKLNFGKISLYIKCSEIKNINIGGVVSGKIKKDTGEELNIIISGAGKLDLKGKCDRLNLNISGASKVDGENFKTEKSDIVISGAAKAKIYCEEKIDVVISGAGILKYKGNAVLNKRISGAGYVKKA